MPTSDQVVQGGWIRWWSDECRHDLRVPAVDSLVVRNHRVVQALNRQRPVVVEGTGGIVCNLLKGRLAKIETEEGMGLPVWDRGTVRAGPSPYPWP